MTVKLLGSLILFGCGLLFLLTLPGSVCASGMCPDIPSGGGQTMSATATKTVPTSCSVTNGMYVLKNTTLRLDAIATANGQCQIVLPQCSGAGCTCVPSSTIQERVLYFIDSWVDITSEGLNGTYAVGRVYGKNPNGTTGYFHVLDTTQANTTGPLSSLVSAAGQYLYHFRGSIATTACNILPGTTPTADIMVHARSALHKGQVNGGSQVGGGQKLSPLTGPGYMYYAGDTVPADGRDTYGSPEWAHRTIKEVGLLWSSPHPDGPKLQVGDISKLGGGPWTEHPGGTHQNGLNIDMRYDGSPQEEWNRSQSLR